MSKLIPILEFEEGYEESPYIDTEGYPTVAGGIKIGPKGSKDKSRLAQYTFTVPKVVGRVWQQYLVDQKTASMRNYQNIQAALKACNDARADILYSMAYQMGVSGLADFKNTLVYISNGQFDKAADGMLNSLWAKQTPNRAKRHADVMRSGTYDAYKGKI